MAKINPDFTKELNKYGAFDPNACYNCGHCTAVCGLSDEQNSFPRKMVRYSVLGLESEIKASLDPWLCYYCGECTASCPREADPGELMMSLRRYLTAKYDWTGLSGLLYKYLGIALSAFVILAVAVIGFGAYVDFDLPRMMHFGHLFEMIAIASVFLLILTPNILHMWWLTVYKSEAKPKLKSYINSFSELIVHMFTQKRSLGCDDNRFRWLEHLILVFSYLLLLFTTVFLNWFETENVFVIVLGYVESLFIFIITFDFVRRRMKKDTELSTHSQPSDWFFVIWLLLMGLTAILVRLAVDLSFIESNSWIYYVHLIVLVQWALIIVPFGKWTHFLYRSFAMYFQKIINAA
jgi:quinone-modifying oxidoreductase subunit QmoC